MASLTESSVNWGELQNQEPNGLEWNGMKNTLKEYKKTGMEYRKPGMEWNRMELNGTERNGME
jgi:hypothetical protein